MGWDEAWRSLSGRDYSKHKLNITVEEPKSMLQKLFGCFAASLDEKLKPERDLVYCLAKQEYEPEDPIHFGLIRGIHTYLTGHPACPAYGLHWKKIGFQSEDPSRDFRATGVLGPLQVASFLQKHGTWAREIYQLSIDEHQNFPLMVSQFGITRICLEVFRSGKLNGFCNGKNSFIASFDELYFAVTALLFQTYKSRHGTASQYGLILQEVETKVKNRSSDLMKKYLTVKLEPYLASICDLLI